MDPAEYRALRKILGTQKEAAEKLGVASNTIARRERGESPIDHEAALALRHAVQQSAGVRRAAP